MSKRFKTQDYFRFKKLGKRWRRPVGLQSKLRRKKGGSGMKVAVGYGTANKPLPLIVYNVNDLQKDCSNGILIAASVGAKKSAAIAAQAKEMNIRIVNMNKAKAAINFKKSLEKRKEKKTEKSEKRAEKSVKKMGFHESTVPHVIDGAKTKTFRTHDHGFVIGDKVEFENSQKSEIIGSAVITGVETRKVKDVDLKDNAHHATYDNVEQLITALKKHHPEAEVSPETDVFIYTYKFIPKGKKLVK